MTLGGFWWWRSLGVDDAIVRLENWLQSGLATQPKAAGRPPAIPCRWCLDHVGAKCARPVITLHRDHRGGLRADLQPVGGGRTDLLRAGWAWPSVLDRGLHPGGDHAHGLFACALRDSHWTRAQPFPAENTWIADRAERLYGAGWRCIVSPKRVLSFGHWWRRGGLHILPALGGSFCRISARVPGEFRWCY